MQSPTRPARQALLLVLLERLVKLLEQLEVFGVLVIYELFEALRHLEDLLLCAVLVHGTLLGDSPRGRWVRLGGCFLGIPGLSPQLHSADHAAYLLGLLSVSETYIDRRHQVPCLLFGRLV